MSENFSKIIQELNNKNFNKALELSENIQQILNYILNNLKGVIFINLKIIQRPLNVSKSLSYKENYVDAYLNLANVYFSNKKIFNR